MKICKIPEVVEFRQNVEVIEGCFDFYTEHRHEFYEFEYVVEGNGGYVLNGESFELNRGDLVFVTPMDFHSYTKGNEKFRTVTVKFVPESLGYQLRNITKLDSFILHCDEELKKLFFLIKSEKNEKSFAEISVQNILQRILIIILRIKSFNEESAASFEIGQIAGYISLNFRNPLSLCEVAGKCGCSPPHFCRQFKKNTGKTFVEYLNGIRTSHANIY